MGKIFGAICISLGLVLVATFGLFVYGKSLPEYHKESLTLQLEAPPEKVWEVITTYDGLPSWWDQVSKVEKEVTPEGKNLWWYFDIYGKRLAYETVEETANQKLVRQVATTEVPFGGTWTFELAPAQPQGTQLTLTEYGFIRPPFFRATTKIFVGYRKKLDSFGAALEKKINQTAL